MIKGHAYARNFDGRLLAIEKRLDDLMAFLACEKLILLLSIHQAPITRLNIPEYHIDGEAMVNRYG